jgi:antibiotic biosynthesis monooxygenase (ABM) superfamily enzyme
MGRAPWMLVTAVVAPAVQGEFDAWHRSVHMPKVLAIPGIQRGMRLRNPGAAVTYATLYQFEDEAALRTALASSEAQEARTDWQRWTEHVRDITVHFYGEYEPRPTYVRLN